MAVEIEPRELAQLLDLAERSRASGWSLRSALTRYAQGEPTRVSNVLELVRRIDVAVRPQLGAIAEDGPALWFALNARSDGESEGVGLVGLLACMVELDRLGDMLATWAGDPIGPTADVPSIGATVDAIVEDIAARLDRLGIAREERPTRAPRGGVRRRG